MNRAERLARALWNQERSECARDDGGSMPAFFTYADGKQEPMPWDKQDSKLHKYFLNRACRLLRALDRSARAVPGDGGQHER